MRWKSLGWKLIALLIIAGGIFLWLIKAPVMSWYLTDKLQVSVSVRTISIWPSETTIHRFRVANPRGFTNKTAFEAKKTTINYRAHQLLGNPREIDRIEVDDIFLSIDCSNPFCSSNNWTAIGNKMAQKQQKEPSAPGHPVIVHKMILSNMTVQIHGLGIGNPPQTKQIAYLEFDEVNSQKGFPTQKLIQAIFQGAGIGDYIKQVFIAPDNVIQQVLPNLFGDVP